MIRTWTIVIFLCSVFIDMMSVVGQISASTDVLEDFIALRGYNNIFKMLKRKSNSLITSYLKKNKQVKLNHDSQDKSANVSVTSANFVESASLTADNVKL